MADGILAVWTDVADEGAADFEEWYVRQHVNERASCAGFLSGARYSAIEGSPKVFAVYETQAPEALFSDAYQAQINNPTPWTQRVLPHFRGIIRTVMRVRARQGEGRGGVCCTIRLEPAVGEEDGLEAWLADEALPALVARPGVVRAELWQAEPKSALGESAESRLRQGDDRTARWVLAVDAADEGSLRRAVDEIVPNAALQRHGAAAGAERGLYRLIYVKASSW